MEDLDSDCDKQAGLEYEKLQLAEVGVTSILYARILKKGILGFLNITQWLEYVCLIVRAMAK